MWRWTGTVILLVAIAVALVRVTLSVTSPPARSGILSPPSLSASTPPSAPTPSCDRVVGLGLVEPCTGTVAVGTPVPGVVSQVLVKAGQQVQAGDPLYSIDGRQFQGTLRVREAALLAAEAELSRMEKMPRPELLPAAQAKVREAKAELAAKQDLLERATGLRPLHGVAEEEYVMYKQACEVARERVICFESELALLRAGAWEPDKAVARAAVARAKAEVEQARIDLDRLLVRAPISGLVLQVNVRPSEFVGLTSQPSAPVQPAVVLGGVGTLRVRVDLDGQDIPRFRPGCSAEATPRGHSQPKYPLEFVCVLPCVIPKKSSGPAGASGGAEPRVLQVIYALRPGDYSLYVGQQLEVSIDQGPEAQHMPPSPRHQRGVPVAATKARTP